MKNQKQIRRTNGPSSYWNNQRAVYGKYQWNVKYYDYQSEDEIEYIQLCLLGVEIDQGQGYFAQFRQGFTALKKLLNKDIESWLDGRSGGWLVINTPLTDEELSIVDEYVSTSMKQIPKLLKEFREENKRSES